MQTSTTKTDGRELTTFIVTWVRKERSADGTHRHIEGVCTGAGVHYTCREVVESIRAGNVWKTLAGGYEAVIEPIEKCPIPSCSATPYLRTNPESNEKDNLENLDSC
jgi:Protein of unknown function (DUF3892)